MKTKRKIYANIICGADEKPYKMIITDGETTTTIPVSNSRVSTCKKTARDIYRATQIFVSIIQDDSH